MSRRIWVFGKFVTHCPGHCKSCVAVVTANLSSLPCLFPYPRKEIAVAPADRTGHNQPLPAMTVNIRIYYRHVITYPFLFFLVWWTPAVHGAPHHKTGRGVCDCQVPWRLLARLLFSYPCYLLYLVVPTMSIPFWHFCHFFIKIV